MGEAVQDPRAAAKPGDGAPVFLLIQEKARFLAVFHIHQIADPVLRDGHKGLKGLTEEALRPGQPLLFPHLRVAPLVDAPDPDPVLCQDLHEGIQYEGLETVDPQGQ